MLKHCCIFNIVITLLKHLIHGVKIMKYNNNLKSLTGSVAGNLLDSMYLLDVLSVLIDGEAKMETLRVVIYKKIKSAFENIEKCRKHIA